METIFKGARKISVAEALGLDPNDPDDRNWLQFRHLLAGLTRVMAEKGVSMKELARRMKISRQAVYEKFSGKNTSMAWIQRACDALGVEIQITYVDKKKAA
ncbi:MAG: helix-turn-helix transcriptional regulator [Deltaproteobacteria bacterium]|nr:helix-turn-helix transcriptional regulator [Deltaproteobacteria bacterium]